MLEGRGNHTTIQMELAPAKQHPTAGRLDHIWSFCRPVGKHVQAELEYCEYIAFIHALGTALGF